MRETAAPLEWRVDGPYEVASDRRRLYVRETAGSETLNTLVAVALMIGSAFFGWRLVQAAGLGSRVFGGLLILLAVFLAVVGLRQLLGALGVISAPTRRPLIVFDRGDGAELPAAIECGGRRVPTSSIRSLSTRPATVGSRHELARHIIVAEMHDGGEKVLGVNQPLEWTVRYAQQGARWLGISYRAHVV